MDLGSEYGRLLAERDRLIASGVDPAALEVPLAPPEELTDPIPDETGVMPEPPEDDPEASEVDIPDLED